MAVMPIAYAQQLSGIITDQETQLPIVYASVYLPQLEKGTATNESGVFTINNIPSGTYKVVVSYIGYQSWSGTITTPLKKDLLISLTPSAIEMEAVIISTPFHKLQSENVMKVERKSIAALQTHGSVTLAQGITDIPGVESVTTGIGIGKPVIRGLSSNRVLVYTQGVRLENQQFGSEHGLGVNDAGIESVEVIKGPASLLYGSDALGGVLYLNPETFAASNTNAANIQSNYFTNTQGLSTNIGYKASGERFKFLFRGSLTGHSDYKTQAYRVTNTRYKEQDFKAGWGYQAAHFKTAFRYNLNHSKIGIPEVVGLQSTSKTSLLPYQDLTNHVFSSKSVVFLNNSNLEFNLGYTYNNREEFEDVHHHHEDAHEAVEPHEHEHDHDQEEHAVYPSLQMKLKTFNYDVKYHLPELGKVETIIGVQGMHQTNSNYGKEQLIPNATTNDVGVLSTTHIHFEKVDIQLGARFDNRNLYVNGLTKKAFNSVNGALGFITKFSNYFTLRTNMASGFRAPNLAELTSFGVHHGSNRFEVGNLDLNTEQNLQTDFNFEFKNKHVEVYANGFYNRIKNYIFLAPSDNKIEGFMVFNYVQDDAKLYGGEIGVHFHPHPLDWLHIESNFETVVGKQDNNAYLPLIPANTLNNTLRVEIDNAHLNKGYAFIKLASVFAQNKVSAFETTSSGYHLFSAGLGGTFTVLEKALTLRVTGNNLFNTRYIYHLSRLKPDNIFDIGRNVSVNLNIAL